MDTIAYFLEKVQNNINSLDVFQGGNCLVHLCPNYTQHLYAQMVCCMVNVWDMLSFMGHWKQSNTSQSINTILLIHWTCSAIWFSLCSENWGTHNDFLIATSYLSSHFKGT